MARSAVSLATMRSPTVLRIADSSALSRVIRRLRATDETIADTSRIASSRSAARLMKVLMLAGACRIFLIRHARLESGEGGARAAQRSRELHGDLVVDPPDPPLAECPVAA